MERRIYASEAGASDVKARPIDPVRIGLVGVGSRGTGLLKVLLDLEGVEIRAVCDVAPERVARARSVAPG